MKAKFSVITKDGRLPKYFIFAGDAIRVAMHFENSKVVDDKNKQVWPKVTEPKKDKQ